MRSDLHRVADALHVRATASAWRDRLVGLLAGGSDADEQRNRKDDRNFKLLLRFMLRPDSNYLDVGASRGKFLRDVVRFAPGGHHIAYEPAPDSSEHLRSLFPWLEVRQVALSDHEGTATFVQVVEPGFRGYSRLETYTDKSTYPAGLRTEALEVRTERLDGHLPEGWLPHFVKIDVEGAELSVLEGGIGTLRRARPVVAFEHGDSPDADTSREIHRLLTEGAGLRVFDMDGEGPYDAAQFLEGLTSRWNWLAHE